ncbi:GrdX family protein [Isachenkonia alkalipeptolytica]
MNYLLVTNNPLVKSMYQNRKFLLYLDGSYLEVLYYARDQIHKGHELLSHPLSGSIKPNETPYKSLLISRKAKSLNYQSVTMIEDSIETTKKFFSIQDRTQGLRQDLLSDFQEIDYHLIKGALESAK